MRNIKFDADRQVNIFLVEDHPIFRHGLRELIEQDPSFHVCGEADSVGTAWSMIEKIQPDLVVVDISLAGRGGLELTRMLKEEYPQLPTLVLSMHEESIYAERALQAGARGYIMKHETANLIIDAISQVCAGKVYLSAKMTNELLTKMVGGTVTAKVEHLDIAQLTNRELEVFELIGIGKTTREISDELCLSPKTIGTYRERIKEKMNFRNSAELTHRAVQWVEVRNSQKDDT